LKFLIEFIRSAVLFHQGQDPDLADGQEVQALRRLSDRAGPEQWLELLERCLEADYQIDRRLQLVLVLEAVIDALGQGLQTSTAR
jgi:DNA polymerase-3 subunit delta'